MFALDVNPQNLRNGGSVALDTCLNERVTLCVHLVFLWCIQIGKMAHPFSDQ